MPIKSQEESISSLNQTCASRPETLVKILRGASPFRPAPAGLGRPMASKTTSEEVFERFCSQRRIPVRRIPEADTRTPDYELDCGQVRVVVEVKEVTPNDEERESERLALERGVGKAVDHTPGDRVRHKIKSCSGQIKARTRGVLPSMLVVFDRGRVAGHVDPYNIRVAMYGLEQVHIAVPPIGMGSPHAVGMGYGPKRQMTPEHNTSISAIGALVMTGPDDIYLNVYHNKFAQVPLPPGCLAAYAIQQFKLADDTPGTVAGWELFKIDEEP